MRRTLLIALLCSCGTVPEAHAPPIASATASDESTTYVPEDHCPAFVGCAELCEPGDAPCREQCAALSDADAEECVARRCDQLADSCGNHVDGACEELVAFCGEPEGTSSDSSTGGESTDTSTGEAPDPCAAYFGCVEACGFADGCVDACARIVGAEPLACEAQRCAELEDACGAGDATACGELFTECAAGTDSSTGDGTSSGTDSDGSGSESSTDGGTSTDTSTT